MAIKDFLSALLLMFWSLFSSHTTPRNAGAVSTIVASYTSQKKEAFEKLMQALSATDFCALKQATHVAHVQAHRGADKRAQIRLDALEQAIEQEQARRIGVIYERANERMRPLSKKIALLGGLALLSISSGEYCRRLDARYLPPSLKRIYMYDNVDLGNVLIALGVLEGGVSAWWYVRKWLALKRATQQLIDSLSVTECSA